MQNIVRLVETVHGCNEYLIVAKLVQSNYRIHYHDARRCTKFAILLDERGCQVVDKELINFTAISISSGIQNNYINVLLGLLLQVLLYESPNKNCMTTFFKF